MVFTFRYLSTGMTFRALASEFHLGVTTVCLYIYRTCDAIWNTLVKLHMPPPTTENLINISEKFYSKFHFPNCIGSINVKQIYTKHHQNKLTKMDTEKNTHSVVLQAIVDADYKFISIEVSNKGHEHATTIFASSTLQKLLISNQFNVPSPECLPGSNVILPYVFLGDETYPLRTYLMRPYPQKNLDEDKIEFNSRLLKARTADSIFKILFHKWKLFQGTVETNSEHGILIVKAACVLYNIIREIDGDNDKDFLNKSMVSMRKRKQKLSRRCNAAAKHALQIRNKFKEYFMQNKIYSC